MSDSDKPRLMSVRDAAKYLNVCERTLWTMLNSKAIPDVRIGSGRGRRLIDRFALDAWIDAQRLASV